MRRQGSFLPLKPKFYVPGRNSGLGQSEGSRNAIRLSVGFAKAIVTTRDHEARRQPLEVPFPGCRKHFIEVVDCEDDRAVQSVEQRAKTAVRSIRRRLIARQAVPDYATKMGVCSIITEDCS